jgi:hypothetical protein
MGGHPEAVDMNGDHKEEGCKMDQVPDPEPIHAGSF